jgi:hypothetical protein
MFLHCGISAKIWYEIARWIGHELILPPSLGHSFSMLVGCGTGKIRKKGLSLIWHAFIWSIWRARNNRIFNDGVIDPEEIFDSIKRILWLWFIERMARVLVFSMSGAGTRENVSIDDGAALEPGRMFPSMTAWCWFFPYAVVYLYALLSPVMCFCYAALCCHSVVIVLLLFCCCLGLSVIALGGPFLIFCIVLAV